MKRKAKNFYGAVLDDVMSKKRKNKDDLLKPAQPKEILAIDNGVPLGDAMRYIQNKYQPQEPLYIEGVQFNGNYSFNPYQPYPNYQPVPNDYQQYIYTPNNLPLVIDDPAAAAKEIENKLKEQAEKTRREELEAEIAELKEENKQLRAKQKKEEFGGSAFWDELKEMAGEKPAPKIRGKKKVAVAEHPAPTPGLEWLKEDSSPEACLQRLLILYTEFMISNPRPIMRTERKEPLPASPDANMRREEGDRARGGPVRVTYYPTPTIDPADPRTAAAGYDRETQTLRVEWGDGGIPYNYYDVTPTDWRNFRRVKSPGRFINRRLNDHPYGPADENA